MSIGATNINAAQNPLLNALVTDSTWSVATINYGFRPGGTRYDDGEGRRPVADAFTAAEKQWIRDELAEISTYVNLSFREVNFANSALDFVKDNIPDGSLGYAFLPENNDTQVVLDNNYIVNDGTAIHEIGHALGLDHPFDGVKLPGVVNDASDGRFFMNNALYTRMAYLEAQIFEARGFEIPEVVNMAALDIAALQAMYGANRTHERGNNTYTKTDESISIWDTGGVDKIDYSAETAATVINLNAATLKVEAGGAGMVSYVRDSGPSTLTGTYTIAYGTVIENATGGRGNDQITGNDVANLLIGLSGNDRIFGNDGNDRLRGDDGGDFLNGGRGNDLIFGNDGNDRLYGDLGNDVLLGGTGADLLSGGEGIDRAQYSTAKSGVAADLQFSDGNTGDAAGDTYASIERLFGSQHADRLRGDAGDNILWGFGGNDLLSGRFGEDDLRGGAGNDRIVAGRGDDKIRGDAGADTFIFAPNHGADIVIGYNDADDRFMFVGTGLGFNDLKIENLGGAAMIDYGTGLIAVVNTAAGVLTEDDFIFS